MLGVPDRRRQEVGERQASELMIPSEVMIIDKVPLLGSGKVDIQTLNKTVQEQAAAKQAVAV